ncbi:MAG: helix-turn-helix domain-containing protein [Patescibacteria group bacterium]|jgi:sugar-specific transcriptional regulator TrmB
MSQITDSLKNLGLTQTEVKIYLAALKYSTIGVNELVKQTNVNRTTIYHALGTLTDKGLVGKKISGQKILFTATDPKNIQNLLQEKIRMLEKQKGEISAIIPLLLQSMEQPENKISVYHYEGIEGVKTVIEDALYCKSKHWDIISPIKNFFSEFDKNYAKYFVETRQAKGITSRSLWEYQESQKLMTPQQLLERNPRVLPPVMYGKFSSVIDIYDDKVLIISSLKELSAVLIQSKEFHDTMLAIFEGLWSVSSGIILKNSAQ